MMTLFPTGISQESLQHFLMRAHHRHWHTRVFSGVCIVVLIALLEGKTAAILGAVWLVAVAALEVWAFTDSQNMRRQIDGATAHQRDAMVQRLCIHASSIAAFYALPAIGLAFGDNAGKVFGLILSASILMNIATQHVLHPRLVAFSLPFPAIGFLACAIALTDDATWIIAFIVAVYVLQTVLLTRTATRSNAALIDAQNTAISEATARGAADAANQTKSNFLANMSHELRTPLNAVIGYGEILKENAQFESRKGDVGDIDKVLVSAKRLLGLVGEILDASKIEAGAMVPERILFDIVPELQTALDMVRPTAAQNGNTLVAEFEPNLGNAISDPLRFSQCVLNLLSNAVKFTQDGHITLSATRRAAAQGEIIVVSVSDTGIGISPENLNLIFEPFAQADETSTRKYGGTGLGLSLTRSLAKLMGGDVTVSSEIGKGSRFELTILANLAPVA